MKFFRKILLSALAVAGVLSQSATAVDITLAAPNPSKFATQLSNAATFTDGIASLNLALVKDYQFGTSATGSAPVIPIRNITDLAVYFNAQSDAGGTAVQNLAVERYQAFNTTNFVFGTSDLELTAVLEAGGSADVIAKNVLSAVTAGTVLSFTDVTGIKPGMAVASSSGTPGTGIPKVSSVDAVANTVTVNTAFTLGANASVEFLPVFCPGINHNAVTNSNVLTGMGVPPDLPIGSFYNNTTNGTFAARRVTAFDVTAQTITLDGPVTVTANSTTFFSPPITSAQIWSKDSFQPGKNGLNYVAMEITLTLPANTTRGAWPAFWLYQTPSATDASEIDWFEFFYGATSGPDAFTSNIHGGAYNVNGYRFSIGSPTSRWDSFGFFRPGVDYSLAQHKIQGIWTPDKVYRFIDGQLIIETDYLWSSHNPAQWSADVGAGSFLTSFLTTYFYPKTSAEFPYALKIPEVKIWTN